MDIETREFGQLRDGRNVRAFTLVGDGGVSVEILEFGGIIRRLEAPDRAGEVADVVLGFDTLEDYEQHSPYFGALVGRFANRIAGAQFELDGRTVRLSANEGHNQLHGGELGYDKVIWQSEPIRTADGVCLVLRHRDPAGHEGFPGTVNATVTYHLSDRNVLTVDYHAVTDEPTHVNLTQHSYFNLSGQDAGPTLDHVLQLNASRYLPVDEQLIPTGELAAVAGGPMDFTSPKPIGRDIAAAGGYDHCYLVDAAGESMPLIAAAHDPASGRRLEIRGTQPGVQLFTADGMDIAGGKGGVHYRGHGGFCLETQHLPDTPNRPEFPSTLLKPGETYHHQAVWAFTTA